MTRYVAFLRAINVGGHSVIKMTDLKAAFMGAGCRNVKTYIQSGNVIFDTDEKNAPTVFRKVHDRVGALIDEPPVIIFRTVRELQRTLKHDPFKAIERTDDVKIYVAFLHARPARKPSLPLVSAKDAIEAIGMKNLDLFVVSRPIKGGRYGYPNLSLEKQLGVAATTRNWNTLAKIVALATSLKTPSLRRAARIPPSNGKK